MFCTQPSAPVVHGEAALNVLSFVLWIFLPFCREDCDNDLKTNKNLRMNRLPWVLCLEPDNVVVMQSLFKKCVRVVRDHVNKRYVRVRRPHTGVSTSRGTGLQAGRPPHCSAGRRAAPWADRWLWAPLWNGRWIRLTCGHGTSHSGCCLWCLWCSACVSWRGQGDRVTELQSYSTRKKNQKGHLSVTKWLTNK